MGRTQANQGDAVLFESFHIQENHAPSPIPTIVLAVTSTALSPQHVTRGGSQSLIPVQYLVRYHDNGSIFYLEGDLDFWGYCQPGCGEQVVN